MLLACAASRDNDIFLEIEGARTWSFSEGVHHIHILSAPHVIFNVFLCPIHICRVLERNLKYFRTRGRCSTSLICLNFVISFPDDCNVSPIVPLERNLSSWEKSWTPPSRHLQLHASTARPILTTSVYKNIYEVQWKIFMCNLRLVYICTKFFVVTL